MRVNDGQKSVLVIFAALMVLVCVLWVPWETSSADVWMAGEYSPIWKVARRATNVDTKRVCLEIIALVTVAAVAFALAGRQRE